MTLLYTPARIFSGVCRSVQQSHLQRIHSLEKSVPLAHTIFNQKQLSNANGPPLILIHGLFGFKKNWESVAKSFSRKRKVVAVDCRNHGESPSVPDMGYNLMASDIELLMKSLQIQKADVLGHSMGGKVAMVLALNNPELVGKLIVEDVAPDTSRTSEASPYIRNILQAMQGVHFDNTLSLGKLRRSVSQQLAEAIPLEGMRNFILANLKETESGFGWQVNLEAISRHLDELMGFPDSQLTNKGSTLFIGGSESDLIREQHLPMISHFFPGALVRHIQGSGHWVHAEKPREFINLVEDFLQGIFDEENRC